MCGTLVDAFDLEEHATEDAEIVETGYRPPELAFEAFDYEQQRADIWAGIEEPRPVIARRPRPAYHRK